MSNPYIGEIRMFGGSFAPAGWAMCDGQLIAIAENDALFTLIGTTYGGDGQETFALPDLRGRLPIHQGTGPGLSTYTIGEKAGVESVTLTSNQYPQHTHPFMGSGATASATNPQTNVMAAPNTFDFYSSDPLSAQMAPNLINPVGGNQPHDNMMPFLAVTFIISLFGVFPRQS